MSEMDPVPHGTTPQRPGSSRLSATELEKQQNTPSAGLQGETIDPETNPVVPVESAEAASNHISEFNYPQTLVAEALFVAVVCSAQLMTQASLATSVVPVLIIGNSFGITNPGQRSWFTAGYSLTVGTFILIAGRMGDVFGHKPLFVAGFVWFGVWSAIVGFSVYSNQILFDIARAMQGIGPAFLLPNAVAILGRSYPPGRRQDMAFSLFGATAPGGFCIGAVFAALLAERVWWPWAYWVNCFACFLLAIIGYLVIPKTTIAPQSDTTQSIWSRVDAVGSVTGVAALVLFNFAWNQGPVVGWHVPYTYITLILGLLLFAVFVFVEKRFAQHPLLPFGVLKIDTTFALGCIVAGWSSFGIFVVYVWSFLETFRGHSPLVSTAQWSVVSVSGLTAAITTGYILSRVPASVVMLIAMLAFATGGILIATLPVHQSYWAQAFIAFIILPWGMDMSFPAATILTSRAMPRNHQGLAASLVNTLVNYSISIGLGFAGTVETNVNHQGTDVLKGYRGAWYMGVGLAGLGVGIALIFCFVEYSRQRVRQLQ